MNHFYRVVIRFRYNRLPFLIERGCLAPDGKTAVRDVCAAQRAERCEPGSLQVYCEQVFDLGQFSDSDAYFHPTVNGEGDTVKETWERLRGRRG